MITTREKIGIRSRHTFIKKCKTNEFDMQMGFVLGLGLSVFVGLGLYFGAGIFTKDPAVIHLIAIGIPVLIYNTISLLINTSK